MQKPNAKLKTTHLGSGKAGSWSIVRGSVSFILLCLFVRSGGKAFPILYYKVIMSIYYRDYPCFTGHLNCIGFILNK